MTLKAFDEFIYTGRNIITQNKKGAIMNYIYGLDTETINGEPLTMQFSDGKKDLVKWVNKKTITQKFFDILRTLPQDRNNKSIIYVLNLLFDFCQLFYPYWKKLITQEKEKGQFDFKVNGFKIKGFITEDSQFAEIRKNKKVFWLVDIGRFFIGISLDKAIKMLLHEKGKLKIPKGLGIKRFKKTDKKFLSYAKHDVHKTQQIGKLISEFHDKWDISQTFSIAMLAEKIFRHHFLDQDLKGCPYEMIRPCLCSYHGGRNGFYVKAGLYKKVYSYDLVSAYPFAMTKLPNFKNAEYYRVKDFEPDYIGIYKINGYVYDCKYPVLFSHDFKPLKDKVIDTWVTGYELQEALKHKEIDIDTLQGYILFPTCFEETPLEQYVKRFMELKNTTQKENPNYEFYKRLLNALYGKFIQMREERIEENGEEKKKWITGKMFHPFIASLITGKVRSMIHDLEHRFNSIHTSTDSIKTFKSIPKKYLSKDLGGLSLEVEGKCLLLRSRLYLHYDLNGELKKYALHGFKGNAEHLMRIWKEKKKSYKFRRMIKPKEAIIQKKKPFLFEEREDNLNF